MRELNSVSAIANVWMRRRTTHHNVFVCTEAPGLQAAGEHSIKTSVSRGDSAERLNSALSRWVGDSAQSPERMIHPSLPLPVEAYEGFFPTDDTVSAPEFNAVSESSPGECSADEHGERVENSESTSSGDEERERTGSAEEEPADVEKINSEADYYEALQISRNADPETIHRVYRMMAIRFHPDNQRTGNLDRFLLLKRAYQVLSDPDRRAEYDAAHQNIRVQPLPIFELQEFVHGIKGEMNRRLGVLSLLYRRRRLGEGRAGLSVLELEMRMGFPREHLNFTLWYLRSAGYITLEENSDYALTSSGVDYVEANSSSNRVIRQLLTSGSDNKTDTPAGERRDEAASGSEGVLSSKLGRRLRTRRRHKGQTRNQVPPRH